MNKKMITKTALSVTILLLFIVSGFYFYSLLSRKEKGAEMNLYTLMPTSTVAVFETDNMYRLFNTMDQLSYGESYQALHVSDLLNGLKSNLKLLSDSKAHGLSSQMNRILLSTHYPGTPKDQVLYCKFGSDDKTFIENFINQHSTKIFPPKVFEYRGEKIHIYPVGNSFLACYYKPEFLVISYQEKLIEEVIDTHLDKHSILSDSVFNSIINNKKVHSNATLYIKASQIPHGETTEGSKQVFARVAHWTVFDIKMSPNAIYLSGASYDTDSCLSFNNALKAQQPVKTFPTEFLPKSTFYLCQLSVSDFPKMQEQIIIDGHPTKNDSCMTGYLEESNNGLMCNFFFYDEQKQPRNITSISLKDKASAERNLKRLLNSFARANASAPFPQPKYFYTSAKAYPVYALPGMSFIQQLSGQKKDSHYGCFYDDRLLIAPNDSSLYAYIRQMEKGETKSGDIIYEECIGGLATESNCLLMTDMEEMLFQPALYNNLLPSVLFKHKDFFKNFVMTIQFTSAGELIYPNMILSYKGERQDSLFLKP